MVSIRKSQAFKLDSDPTTANFSSNCNLNRAYTRPKRSAAGVARLHPAVFPGVWCAYTKSRCVSRVAPFQVPTTWMANVFFKYVVCSHLRSAEHCLHRMQPATQKRLSFYPAVCCNRRVTRVPGRSSNTKDNNPTNAELVSATAWRKTKTEKACLAGMSTERPRQPIPE